MRLADDTDEGGRGLFLVMSLSRHWGTRYSERGEAIWSAQGSPHRSSGSLGSLPPREGAARMDPVRRSLSQVTGVYFRL
jgi:hypothetical protein